LPSAGRNCDAGESFSRVGPKPASSVGKRPARADWLIARASFTRAAAAFRFWFASCACFSRSLSAASSKIVHHSPRIISSEGCAVFQVPASDASSGFCGVSLYADGAFTSGFS
jgi:predicted naringenin-chalcone synthase